MKKVRLVITLLLFLLSLTFFVAINSVPTKAYITKMFVWPAYFTLADSVNFTVELRVESVWKMNSYQAYLSWDPELLNVTSVINGAFLSNNSQYETLFRAIIDNTLGTLQIYEAQTGSDWATIAVGGNGTLCYINFTAKSTGQCPLDLYSTLILYGQSRQSHDEIDGFFNNEIYNVEADGGNFTVEVNSNSITYNFSFSLPEKSIYFNVYGVDNSTGWANVTIPKALLDAPSPDQWTILVDDAQTTYIKTENETDTFLYINYTHSTHAVTIIGTTVVPEYPSMELLTLLILIFSTTLMFIKKSKKIDILTQAHKRASFLRLFEPSKVLKTTSLQY